ncbi:MAG: hypothetical protein J5874_00320 [Oscillospiraceae bacterium]|nr:hypothetical protein [Oscillospiraceae bacterium]
MILTIIFAVLTFSALTGSILFFPSFHIKNVKIGSYWVVASLGAISVIAFGCVPIKEIWDKLTTHSAINPLKILVLFFSMTFLSVLLDEVGLFRYLAKKAAKAAGGSQHLLFILLYFLISILTVFTSNDIMILTLTPFICFFCKNTKIDPVPFLVSEFAAANTWSMMLIIGNPTNIYLGTSAGIGFVEYFRIMVLPTLCAGSAELFLILFLFRKRLKKKIEPCRDDFKIDSKPDLIIGIAHLLVCLVFLAISDYIGIEMWKVSTVCAVSLLIFITAVHLIQKSGWTHLTHSVKRLPWQLIPFIISMFIMVICLNYQGISQKIGQLFGNTYCIWKYGMASFFSSNITNNIPMSILFSTLPLSLAQQQYYQAIYASIIGSNIGAFLTPIGALAGIMFTELTDRYDVHYGFRQFIKYGILIALPTITVALFVLSLII